MSFLEIVGAITTGILGLGVALIICAIGWGYVQATGGYLRARSIARRYGTTLYKIDRKPRFFAVRMIHWQVWHQRTWSLGGLDVPWTFTHPIKRERRWYPG